MKKDAFSYDTQAALRSQTKSYDSINILRHCKVTFSFLSCFSRSQCVDSRERERERESYWEILRTGNMLE